MAAPVVPPHLVEYRHSLAASGSLVLNLHFYLLLHLARLSYGHWNSFSIWLRSYFCMREMSSSKLYCLCYCMTVFQSGIHIHSCVFFYLRRVHIDSSFCCSSVLRFPLSIILLLVQLFWSLISKYSDARSVKA